MEAISMTGKVDALDRCFNSKIFYIQLEEDIKAISLEIQEI